MQLEKDSYPHQQYGKIWIPVLTIVDWMPLDGPAPAPEPASPPPAEQPRRRRVASAMRLRAGLTAAASPAFRVPTFNCDLIWIDFEVRPARLDLKAVGTFRYAADASTRAIVLAYAIGDAPAQTWHADGAILDWDHAPDDLRAAFDRGATFAAWNAGFDAAIWNYATLGFPFLRRSASSIR